MPCGRLTHRILFWRLRSFCALKRKCNFVQYFPIRLARHTGHPGRADHIDCFVDLEDSGRLPTFILPLKIETLLKNISNCGNLKLEFFASDKTRPKAIWRGKVHRLPDHRRLYFNFVGALSQNRGVLSDIARGFVAADLLHCDCWAMNISTDPL